MIKIGLLGALIAGAYGIVHDQITYSISREYFTQLKFTQFDYANFGFHERVFVGEIGFLATWWVGFFSGWFMARIAVPAMPLPVARRYCMTGFAFIFPAALAGGIGGYLFGLFYSPNYTYWREITLSLHVTQPDAFIRVAYIHSGSYLGALIGLIGLIVAIGFVVWKKRKHSAPPEAAA